MASDETRARIIEAAGPIFAEKGFRDATVREICDAAEVGLASVNYHFRDKQQLYVDVVEAAFDYLDQNRPALREWPDGDSSGGPAARVDRAFGAEDPRLAPGFVARPATDLRVSASDPRLCGDPGAAG